MKNLVGEYVEFYAASNIHIKAPVIVNMANGECNVLLADEHDNLPDSAYMEEPQKKILINMKAFNVTEDLNGSIKINPADVVKESQVNLFRGDYLNFCASFIVHLEDGSDDVLTCVISAKDKDHLRKIVESQGAQYAKEIGFHGAESATLISAIFTDETPIPMNPKNLTMDNTTHWYTVFGQTHTGNENEMVSSLKMFSATGLYDFIEKISAHANFKAMVIDSLFLFNKEPVLATFDEEIIEESYH